MRHPGARLEGWCLVVAGDPSGDAHGAHLVAALKREEPGLRLAAVGGPLMKGVADHFIADLSSRGMTGFWEPVRGLGFLASLSSRLKRFMRERKPLALVCIDYYGFNSHLLKLARGLGVPAYYYISPQVWATRPGRVETLRRLIRKMLVIFPFEEKLYLRAGIPCLFVGHPLLEVLPEPADHAGLGSPLRLGLLPGSRPSEVERHLPLFLDAAELLRRHFPSIRLTVFANAGLDDAHYRLARERGAAVVREQDYRERRALDLAISSSGTATLENALLGVPMIVVYKLSWPTYAIARALINVQHIAMVNILAGRALVPEMIQHEATPESVARKALALLENPRRYAALRRDLLALRPLLGKPGASRLAAREIVTGILRPLAIP